MGELRWAADSLPSSLAVSWDVVVASDVVIHASRPGDRRPGGLDSSTDMHLRDLKQTAAMLLDPRGFPSRFILTFEPRDRLGGGHLSEGMLSAAKAAGLTCLEQRQRRLDGQFREEWQTDVYVFGLAFADEIERSRDSQAVAANGVLQKAVDVSCVLTRAQSPCSYKRCPCV